MNKLKLFIYGFTLIFIFSKTLYSETQKVDFFISSPVLIFNINLSKEDRIYLGLPPKKNYRLEDINGSLLLIEFLNTYCINCEKQAPILNEVFNIIEGDPKLKKEIKIIGIAAGNNLEEVKDFKSRYKIPYPILPDPNFNAHQAFGSPCTPFMIWVRKNRDGKGIVVSTHLGVIESSQKLIDETKAVLQYDLALLKPKIGSIYEGEALKPPLTEEELIAKARIGMESSGGNVVEIKKVELKDGDSIYIGRVDFGTYQKNLFSKLATRRAICDICHDTFFFYTFDPEGKVIDIIPIQLTKVGNQNWSDEDIKKLKNIVVGRSIFKTFSFDPKVDSISGATITAVLIFDSLEKAKEIYEKVKKEGYIKN